MVPLTMTLFNSYCTPKHLFLDIFFFVHRFQIVEGVIIRCENVHKVWRWCANKVRTGGLQACRYKCYSWRSSRDADEGMYIPLPLSLNAPHPTRGTEICVRIRVWLSICAYLVADAHGYVDATNVGGAAGLELPEGATSDRKSVRLCQTESVCKLVWVGMDQRRVPLQLWTHYDHLGPRTTNLAEEFHNSLINRFGVPHPSIRTLLDWLQKCHYETQCRAIQLTAGRTPKQKTAEYVHFITIIIIINYYDHCL